MLPIFDQSGEAATDLRRSLPLTADALSDGHAAARFLADRHLRQEPAVLLRYGDTCGRIMNRPAPGTPEYAYAQKFLGATVTPTQIDWMATKIHASVKVADVIGLRSDLLGPALPVDLLKAPDDEVLPRLANLYPIRAAERTSLPPDDARRLAETRWAMEQLPLPAQAILTDAWVHFSLADIGFFGALFRHASGIAVCTSSQSHPVLRMMAASLPGRVRVYDCPANPMVEATWGGDHAFLWDRWLAIHGALRPSYPGEPLLISAGIWTKVLAPRWAELGGIAIDMGAVMDCFQGRASRPAVLLTRYSDAQVVPQALTLEYQLARTEKIEDFLG